MRLMYNCLVFETYVFKSTEDFGSNDTDGFKLRFCVRPKAGWIRSQSFKFNR